MKYLENNNAVVVDGIVTEVVKPTGKSGINEIRLLCNTIWKTGEYPKNDDEVHIIFLM